MNEQLKGFEILLGFFTLLVSIGIAYLRLYVGSVMKSQTMALTETIVQHTNEVRRDVYSREIMDAKIEILKGRIDTLEEKLNRES